LGKRKGAHAQNQWATPGGHLEFTETWVGCAYREVEEEVGIKVDNIRFGFATNDIFVEDNKHYVTIDMVADYISGEVQLLEPEKCEKWQWFSWDDLPSPLIVTTENAIKRGFNPFAV
jgi:8-oxo-dGTP diphosphatase